MNASGARRRIFPRASDDEVLYVDDEEEGGVEASAEASAPDALVQPAMSAAIIAHFCVSDRLNLPSRPVNREVLMTTIKDLLDVRQWKVIAQRRCGLTPADTSNLRRKDDVFQLLRDQCPF